MTFRFTNLTSIPGEAAYVEAMSETEAKEKLKQYIHQSDIGSDWFADPAAWMCHVVERPAVILLMRD